jgi:hypothetical protein
MDVSTEEARESLAQAGATTEAAREVAAYSGPDWLFIIWGLVWLLGYVGTAFLGRYSGLWWLALLSLGGMASGLVYKASAPVRWESSGRNIGWLWLALWVYVWLWISLLWPFLRIEGRQQSELFWKHGGALAGTVPAFAYVVMGLWLQARLLIWLGVALTVILLFGLFVLQPYFFYWAGIVGGGTLIATGVIVRQRWVRHARH